MATENFNLKPAEQCTRTEQGHFGEELKEVFQGPSGVLARQQTWTPALGPNAISHLLDDNEGPRNAGGQPDAESPLYREAELALAGIASVPEAAVDAFKPQNLGHTATVAAESAAATLALTCLSRQAGLRWAVGRVLGPATLVSAVPDIAHNAGAVYGAFADNWDSDKNWQKNVATVKNSFGKTVVDFAIASAAGGSAHLEGSNYFAWKPNAAAQLPELNLANLRTAKPGETTSFKLQSDGAWRQVDLSLPHDFSFDSQPAKARNLLIGVDGILMNKQPGMAVTNGLAQLAGTTGDIGAFPHAGTFRLVPGLKVASWLSKDAGFITPATWLAPRAEVSETNLISKVNRTVKDLLGTKETAVVGFSEGGNFAHQVAAKLGKDEIQGVGSVEGTLTGIEAPPVPGIRAVIVQGTADPTIPYNGGAGGLTKLLSNLGHNRMETSNPLGQVMRYIRANEFEGTPIVNNLGEGVTETIYPGSQMKHGGEVRFYKLEGGMHAYPNRSVGNAEDKSMLAGVNGGPSSFDINSRLAKVLFGPRT